MTDFLDSKLTQKLRDSINSSNIFHRDENLNKDANWLLICAIMDRLDSAVSFLNKNEKPSSEEDFLLFMMYASILKDAISILFKKFKIDNPSDFLFFKNLYENSDITFNNKKKMTDDLFFEYCRALIFAHPFETSRSLNYEIHYAPFPIVDHYTSEDEIGILIYSNKKRRTIRLNLPRNRLNNYIKSKFEKLTIVIDKINTIIKNKEDGWLKRKVDRKLSKTEILEDIISIQEERYQASDDSKILLNLLQFQTNNEKNMESLKLIQYDIILQIPDISDSIDNFDDNYFNIIHYFLYEYPKDIHPMANYQLEKIHCYLDDGISSGNQEWGKIQANDFSKEFAKKWVDIDVDNMSYEEIKLLAIVACYLEKKEQEGKK